MPHVLPALSYAYDALEPHIDAQTMEIHHSKHHQTYINNLNAALEGTEFAEVAVEELLQQLDRLPDALRGPVINNGGGHANHSLFWTVMAPDGGGQPQEELRQAIDAELGGYDAFCQAFTKAALTRFGSGWAWLCVDPPADAGKPADPRPGCLGACVLPALPESPAGIHCSFLQRRGLGGSTAPLPAGVAGTRAGMKAVDLRCA